jgi:hypothetical protein
MNEMKLNIYKQKIFQIFSSSSHELNIIRLTVIREKERKR